jgi:3-oxoadipate enol-lactonase
MALHQFDRMIVEDEGEGPVIVCVHGLGGSSNTFTPLMPALTRYRVIRPDLPGSARSQEAEGTLSIDRFVQALLSMCERLGIQQAHWVGHSMGTIVCQHLALAQPALAKSLCLFGPLMAPADPMRQALRTRANKAKSEGASGMQDITQALLAGALSADTRQRLPLAVAFVRESLMRQKGEAYGRNCEALADAQPARVEGISAPVLLVTGDEDGVAPPQAVRAMAEKLHGTASKRVVVLPRCGHWTPVERPQECQHELGDFLAKQRS